MNGYIWELYLKAGGNEIIKFFERNLLKSFSKNYAGKICELYYFYCPSKTISDLLFSALDDLNDSIHIENHGFLYGCYSIIDLLDSNYTRSDIMLAFYQGLNDSGSMSDNEIFSEFSCEIAYYTTFLSIIFPAFFVPYYFKYTYNILEKIAQEFHLKLPPMPAKRDYKARFFYYEKICAAFYDFRTVHQMSLCELCAFLYDFAPKYIGGIDSYIMKALPEPKSAFFIGGSKDDVFLSDDPNTVEPWQCSPDTRAGDQIVMYLRAPVSAIDSIWRSVSAGFNDPFFYFYRCTYIAHPQKIKQISQKYMKQDSVFKELSIVRKNMQGINGIELYPSAYNHLLDLAESSLPRLTYMTDGADSDFTRERDVENKRIKPFLKKLGYTENEYQQQLYMEIGNHNHALIPDFVIHPIVTSGHQSAAFIIEAKLSISSTKLLEEAKTQARGYAKLLNAKYSVIAAKEGIWISDARDDYSKDILSFTWSELNDEDHFFTVFKQLGNGKV